MGLFRRVTLVLSVLGFLVFGGLLSITFMDVSRMYGLVEGVAVEKVTDAFPEMVEGLEPESGGLLGALASKVQDQINDKIALWESPERQEQIEGFVRMALDLGCEANCGATDEAAQEISGSIQAFMIAQLGTQVEKLEVLIKEKFQSTISGFLGDIRIVSGANVIAFALAFALSFKAGASQRTLLIISSCLSLGTIGAAVWYVWQVDLISVLLWGNFLGYGYVTILVLCIGFLLDIALNKGRITRLVMDMISKAIGSIPA